MNPEQSSVVENPYVREIARLTAELERLTEVMHWAQAMLTALNVGDVFSGSGLHLKLREVMIAYREAVAAAEKARGT
jgi:hypothetical protein